MGRRRLIVCLDHALGCWDAATVNSHRHMDVLGSSFSPLLGFGKYGLHLDDEPIYQQQSKIDRRSPFHHDPRVLLGRQNSRICSAANVFILLWVTCISVCDSTVLSLPHLAANAIGAGLQLRLGKSEALST